MAEHIQDWFTAADGRTVFYRALVPEAPTAIVLVVHGLHEHSGRYVDLMARLAARGWATYAPDHRGHGRSAKTLGDLESMDAVLGDLGTLHRRAMGAHPGAPVGVIGHSMGGLITTLYCQRNDDVAAAVINAPAVDIPDDTNPAVIAMASVLARLTPRLPVEPFYDPDRLSRDPAVKARVEGDPLYYKGKLRARTGHQLLESIKAAVARLDRLTLPILVTHGTADEVMPKRASEKLYGGAASEDKTLRFFDGLLHEVHNEPEREEVLRVWLDWLAERL